jgi:hypothetical protein
MTAMFLPVRFVGGRAIIQPSKMALSAIVLSIDLMETGSEFIPHVQADSQGAGQSLPVNSGKLFVPCRLSNASCHLQLYI